MKSTPPSAASRDWVSLNEALREADEITCQRLIDEELAGQRRRSFVFRIHSRLNKVRAERERFELEAKL